MAALSKTGAVHGHRLPANHRGPAASDESGRTIPTDDGTATPTTQILTSDTATLSVIAPVFSNNDNDAGAGAGAGAESGRPTVAATDPAIGRRVGPYRILNVLGHGGMGAVFAAYDSRVARRVALKLLHNRFTQRRNSRARKRLAREARTLAKLSHPNIVTVYDAGHHRGDVFLAMEMVEGQSIHEWTRSSPSPSWRAILAAYIQAAHGLAAAHRLGIIHRDFKPANVMRSNKGCIKVADFGIARLSALDHALEYRPRHQDDDAVSAHPAHDDGGDMEDSEISQSVSGSGLADLASGRLTVTGALVGTPRFMAPEQHRCDQATSQTDQYAFCASLYESLCGRPAFRVSESEEHLPRLLEKKLSLDVTPPPTDTPVPAWLLKVLRRGLSPKPQDRFACMEALIAALQNDPVRQRKRMLAAIASMCAVACVAAITLWSTNSPWTGARAAARTCSDTQSKMTGIWDESRKAQLRTAFAATRRQHASDTADRTTAILDTYADDWADMRILACEATHLERIQSDAVFDLRIKCLERRLSRLAALTDILVQDPDSGIIDRSVQSARALPAISDCADIHSLRAVFPLPPQPETRRRIAAIEQKLDHVETMYLAGKYRTALPLAQARLQESRQLDYLPVIARAMFLVGQLRTESGDPKSGEHMLRTLLPIAAELRDDRLAALAWAGLFDALGHPVRDRPHQALERALDLIPVAHAASERTQDPHIHARLRLSLATVLTKGQRLDEARGHAEAALAIFIAGADDDFSSSPLQLSRSHRVMGTILWQQNQHREALTHLQRAVMLAEETLGSKHPETARALSELGLLHSFLSDTAQARQYLERALHIWRNTLGDDHAEMPMQLIGLADSLLVLGQVDRALTTYRRALDIAEEVLGAEHPLYGVALAQMGNVLVRMGHVEPAIEYHERALQIAIAAMGPAHPQTANLHNGLAVALQTAAQYQKAHTHFERALDIWRVTPPDNELTLATAYANIAVLSEAQGQLQAALRHQRWALDIRTRLIGNQHRLIAQSHSQIGNLLRRTDDFVESHKHLELALQVLEGLYGPDHLDIAHTLNSLGVLHSDWGRFAKARAYYTRSLRIRTKILGADNVDVANTHNNLGVLCQAAGQYRQAQYHLQQSFDIYGKQFGDDHPSTRLAAYNLALVLRDIGEYDRALAMTNDVIASWQSSLGPKHAYLGFALTGAATIHYLRGEYAMARRRSQRALGILQSTLSAKHSRIASTLEILGKSIHALGDEARALRYLERAVQIRIDNPDSDPHKTAAAQLALGQAVFESGDLVRARMQIQRALATFEAHLSQTHPQLNQAVAILGQLELARGDFAAATQHLQRAHSQMRKSLGHSHPHVAEVENAMAALALRASEPERALASAERALAVCTSAKARCRPASQFTVARALWMNPARDRKHRTRARNLARQARRTYAAAGQRQHAGDIGKWLRTRRMTAVAQSP